MYFYFILFINLITIIYFLTCLLGQQNCHATEGRRDRRAAMAKKRDRRAVPSRRKNEVVSSDQPDVVADSSSDRRLIIIFLVFFVISPAISVLVYHKYTSTGAFSGASVFERGLVKTDISYQEILAVRSIRIAKYYSHLFDFSATSKVL